MLSCHLCWPPFCCFLRTLGSLGRTWHDPNLVRQVDYTLTNWLARFRRLMSGSRCWIVWVSRFEKPSTERSQIYLNSPRGWPPRKILLQKGMICWGHSVGWSFGWCWHLDLGSPLFIALSIWSSQDMLRTWHQLVSLQLHVWKTKCFRRRRLWKVDPRNLLFYAPSSEEESRGRSGNWRDWRGPISHRMQVVVVYPAAWACVE